MSAARERVPSPSAPSSAASDRFHRAAMLPNGLVPATQCAPNDAAILVTGATGFVGGHLLAALLRRTSAPIICLVRGDAAAAKEKLLSRLASLGADVPSDRFTVVAAALTEPRLGLSAAAFARLADCVGTVFHLAARLDFRSSFDTLRRVNVDAVRHILSLASTGLAKRILYVSSLSVLETTTNYGQTVTEATPLADPGLLPLGYAQTKWTAETLLATARARGFNVLCARPSWIVGHDQNGIETDFIASVVRVFAAIGATPMGSGALNLVPVSFVAEACALLGLSGSARVPVEQAVYHLGMAEAVSARHFAEAIAASGTPMERVPLPVFLARVSCELNAARSLDLMMFRHILVGSPSRPAIGVPYLDGRAPIFDSSVTLRTLRSAGLPPPALDLVALVRSCQRLPAGP